MIEYYRDMRESIVDFIEIFGIDAMYIFTIILLFIVIHNRDNYRYWKKLEKHEKGVLKALLFATIIGVVISILRLIGAI